MRKISIVIWLVFSVTLTGCAGIKNIQDLTYIVAIGMDYDDETEEYIVFLQGLNFANIAKQEGGKPVGPVPIYIASARGESINLAISNLYKKSEPPLFFGHVRTLVMSQKLINEKADQVLEEIARNRSVRHRLRLVTTEESIEEVLNIKALFDYPAVYTVLYREKVKGLAQEELNPTSLLYFLRDYYEPMGVAKIPIVKIDKATWFADEDYPILFFDGYSVFSKQKFITNIPIEDSIFIEWLQEERISLNEKVEEDGKIAAVLNIDRPKMKIKYDKNTSQPKMTLKISVNADVVGKMTDIKINKLKKIMEKNIQERVERIYLNGVEEQIDIFNFGEGWFRKYPKQFKKLKNNNEFYLTEDSLQKVEVDVQILNFNSYEYEKHS